MTATPRTRSKRPGFGFRRGMLVVALAAAFVGLVALGNWQVARRAWKLELIAQVERQLHAAPVAAPEPGTWALIGKGDEYRRIRIDGRFRHDLETCTQAVTVRGPGCWVMTPMQTDAGWWLLINRGFVDNEHRSPASRLQGQIKGNVEIDGLLRLSEPHGGFLRANDAGLDRWTSRDVAAIAAARGLGQQRVAPYFVDAEASVPGGPVGGMTIVRFRNSHLIYALTWYGLAVLTLAAVVLVLRTKPGDARRCDA